MARTSEQEIRSASTFAEKLRQNSTRFAPEIEAQIGHLGRRASIFDIETGGLSSKSPIYEYGIQHGLTPTSSVHSFVSPTNISGTAPGEISDFTKRTVAGRAKGTLEAIHAAGTSQRDAARDILSNIQGRDVWVQNLGFERGFVNERMGPGQFDQWARGAGKLESVAPSNGQLYTTTPALKQKIADASRAGFGGSTDDYLRGWSDVFGEFKNTLGAETSPGTTRVFDMADLTKSVFAKAQLGGHMPRTGELFAGTSVDVLGKAFLGTKELHTALGDNAMQGSLIRELLGAGMTMDAGGTLSAGQSAAFARVGRAQQVIKQRGAERSILGAYQAQQKLYAAQEGEAGAANIDLDDARRRLRIDSRQKDIKIPLDTLSPDGTRNRQWIDQTVRDGKGFSYTTDLDEFVAAQKARSAQGPGLSADWDAAYKRVQSGYINPHTAASGRGNMGRLAALEDASVMGAADSFTGGASKLDSILEPGVVKGAVETGTHWMKSHALPLGVAAGAMVGFAAFISGNDDDYNSIEGLRHGGISGATRRQNTEFGSGYQGVNPKIKDSLVAVDIKDYRVEDADTVQALLAGGDQVNIRLAGIDAPEVQHGESMPGRANEDQPYGQAATSKLRRLMASQKNIKLILNMQAKTSYGRVAGTLVGDSGQDLNLELIRQGAAKALPFGPARERTYKAADYRRAEEQAYNNRSGMWDHDGWRSIRRAEENKRRKATNTSMTNIGRMYDNFKTASMSIRLNNHSSDLSTMMAYGGKDDFNVIEGLRHGWVGAQRESNTDFGSGYVIDRKVKGPRRNARVKRRLQRSHRGAVNHMKKMMQRDNMIQHHLGG